MERQLIEQIVEQVITAMSQGQPALAKPAKLAPKQWKAAPASAPVAFKPAPKANILLAPAKVFITAEVLEQRVAAGVENNALKLAHNEYLTPNARDVADKRRLKISRQAQQIAQPAEQQAVATVCTQDSQAAIAAPAIGMLVVKGDGKVATAMTALRRSGMEMIDFAQTDCWIKNLKSLCAAIASGRVASGVAILPETAGAAMLANKTRSIRAIQGTRCDSVTAAVRRLAPNLLILEHVSLTLHEMRVMIGSFTAQPAGAPTNQALISAVAEAEAN